MLSSRVTLVAFSLAGGWQETAWGCVCGGGELWCINSGDLVKSTTIMTNLEMWLAVKYTNK